MDRVDGDIEMFYRFLLLFASRYVSNTPVSCDNLTLALSYIFVYVDS